MSDHISGADLLRYLEGGGEPEREHFWAEDRAPVMECYMMMHSVPTPPVGHIAEHLAECAECRAKADRLRQAMGVVEAFTCPPHEEVVEFALGDAKAERLPTLRTHFGHCKRCSRLVEDTKAIAAASQVAELSAEYMPVPAPMPARLSAQLSPERALLDLSRQMSVLEARVREFRTRDVSILFDSEVSPSLEAPHLWLMESRKVLHYRPQGTPILRPGRRAFLRRGLIQGVPPPMASIRQQSDASVREPSPFELASERLDELTGELMNLISVSNFPRLNRKAFARAVRELGWGKQDADRARGLVEQLQQLWVSFSHLAAKSAERKRAQRRGQQLGRIAEAIAELSF